MYSPTEHQTRLERWTSLNTMQCRLLESDEQMNSIFDWYDSTTLPNTITDTLSARNDISHVISDIIQQLLDPNSIIEPISLLLDRLDKLMEDLTYLDGSLLDFLYINNPEFD